MKLLPEQILYRCGPCRQALTYSETFAPCFSCGAKTRQPGFRFTDREVAEARDRGFVFADDNFTYVPDRLVKEHKLPEMDELFGEE